MTARDLRRLHDVTDNFFFWQGLRLVPLGLATLIAALTMSRSVPIPSAIRAWISIGVMLVGLWLSSSVLGRYYARNFGRVRSDPSRHAVRASVKWFVVYPGMIAALIADIRLKPPIILSAIVFALAIEAFRESTGGGRYHYIVASLALGALSLLTWFGLVAPGVDAVGAVVGATGVIYMIGGLLDHRELVEVLGSPTTTDAGAI